MRLYVIRIYKTMGSPTVHQNPFHRLWLGSNRSLPNKLMNTEPHQEFLCGNPGFMIMLSGTIRNYTKLENIFKIIQKNGRMTIFIPYNKSIIESYCYIQIILLYSNHVVIIKSCCRDARPCVSTGNTIK